MKSEEQGTTKNAKERENMVAAGGDSDEQPGG